MSTCAFHERVAAHASGEPDAELAAHLPGCAACRRDVAEAEDVLAELRREAAPAVDLDLDLAAIRAGLVTPPARRWAYATPPLLLAAAAAVWLWAGTRLAPGPSAPTAPVAITFEEALPRHAGAPGSLADPDAAAVVDRLGEAGLDLALAALDLADEPGPAADLADPDAAGVLENLDDSLLDAAETAL